MKVVVFSKILKNKDTKYIQHLFDTLHQFQITTLVYAPYLKSILDSEEIKIKQEVKPFHNSEDFENLDIDFFISLGGDGTMLTAALLVQHYDIPLVGINLGRLGFLASVSKEYIEHCVQNLLTKNYSLDKRKLLHLDSSPSDIFKGSNFALNDFTILKRDTSSMITINTYIDGEFLNSYWADGIIIATPTGSTGYSLSCGGPIIFPNSGNFVVTPVAPHNLNVRPIVISDNSVISIEVEGRADNFLCTLDSRFETVTSDYTFAIRKADFNIQLVKFPDRGFLWTIRNKLNWGKDKRN